MASLRHSHPQLRLLHNILRTRSSDCSRLFQHSSRHGLTTTANNNNKWAQQYYSTKIPSVAPSSSSLVPSSLLSQQQKPQPDASPSNFNHSYRYLSSKPIHIQYHPPSIPSHYPHYHNNNKNNNTNNNLGLINHPFSTASGAQYNNNNNNNNKKEEDRVVVAVDSTTNNTNTNDDIQTMTGQECYDHAIQALHTKRIREEEMEEESAKEQYEAMEKSFQRTNDRSVNAAAKEKVVAEAAPTTTTTTTDAIQIDVHKATTTTNAAAAAKAKKRGNSQANIAVVRTITRQTRSKKKEYQTQTQQQKQESDENKNVFLKEEAQRYMQHAAFVHGQKDALVRLGNEALAESRKQQQQDGGDITTAAQRQQLYTYISSSGKDATDDDKDNGNFFGVEEMRSLPSALDRALIFYELAGQQGSAEGWYNRGHLLWGVASSLQDVQEDDTSDGDDNSNESSSESGTAIVPSEFVEALGAFRNAMELGDGDAAYFLGVQYVLTSEEEGWSKYFVELENCVSLPALKQYGFELIQRAGNTYSHGGAFYYLALLYRNGNDELGITPCSVEDFPQHLDRAADCGDADALFLRAYCLHNGEDGYSQDYPAALEGFIQSGEAGNADGYVSAGAMLHQGGYGSAVKQDQRRAFEFYQEAAEMDSKEAWRNLVACYALGEGIPKCEQTSQYIAKTMLNDDNDDQ